MEKDVWTPVKYGTIHSTADEPAWAYQFGYQCRQEISRYSSLDGPSNPWFNLLIPDPRILFACVQYARKYQQVLE